jgi:hypothetical protein
MSNRTLLKKYQTQEVLNKLKAKTIQPILTVSARNNACKNDLQQEDPMCTDICKNAFNVNQLVANIFAGCNRTRELLGDIVRVAEEVQEVAMNAAVSASHTGNHIRVFTEIARQIDHTAQKITNSAANTRAEIDEASNLILKAVLDQSHLRKYADACEGIQGHRNQQILTARMIKIEANVKAKLRCVFIHLFRSQSQIKSLIQLQNRLFAILNAIKIESISLHENEQSTILSLAQSLEDSHIKGLEKLETLYTMTQSMRHQIRTTLIFNEENQDETRQAV